jgi:hypothetical protein
VATERRSEDQTRVHRTLVSAVRELCAALGEACLSELYARVVEASALEQDVVSVLAYYIDRVARQLVGVPLAVKTEWLLRERIDHVVQYLAAELGEHYRPDAGSFASLAEFEKHKGDIARSVLLEALILTLADLEFL